MGNIKELERLKINDAAQNFLCEPETDGDLYDAYLRLKEEKEVGNGTLFASGYVNVPQAFDTLSVDEIIDLIEAAVVEAPEIPEFIQEIDWQLLTNQKTTLLKVIEDCDNVPVLEHLEGLVALLDAFQDYACDTLGLGEAVVFPGLGKEDLGSPWSEIHNDFEDEGIIHIDAWTTADDNEGGSVIAKINTQTKEVQYVDERAKTDSFAQEAIKEVLDRL
jgi:hypothetical protein